MVSDNKEMAQVLNNFFTSIYVHEPPGNAPQVAKLQSRTVLTDLHIDCNSVKKKLLALKPNSAPGPDKISPRVLHSNAAALASIFNKSLDEGTVQLEKGKCYADFHKGDQGGPWQLPASLPDLWSLQNYGILSQRCDCRSSRTPNMASENGNKSTRIPGAPHSGAGPGQQHGCCLPGVLQGI